MISEGNMNMKANFELSKALFPNSFHYNFLFHKLVHQVILLIIFIRMLITLTVNLIVIKLIKHNKHVNLGTSKNDILTFDF